MLLRASSELYLAIPEERAINSDPLQIYEDFDTKFDSPRRITSQVAAWQRLVDQWENHYNTKVFIYN